jgi:hypothetical protein
VHRRAFLAGSGAIAVLVAVGCTPTSTSSRPDTSATDGATIKSESETPPP